MPWAKDGQISQSRLAGGIEISEDQYALALEGMMTGKLVNIQDGFSVVDPPSEANERDERPEVIADGYQIGKATIWRRMTDDEAVAVKQIMARASVRQQMIYDAALYIDTSDELFGILKELLHEVLPDDRVDALLAPES